MSLSQHDQEWATNFARSMNEKYGRHNSSHFRPNIVRRAESIFGRNSLEEAARPMAGDDGLRVIGRIHCRISRRTARSAIFVGLKASSAIFHLLALAFTSRHRWRRIASRSQMI